MSAKSGLSQSYSLSLRCSSTTLDSWTWTQLRKMKVGGNAPALEYFTRNGGNAYLAPGTEGKVKYTSATARGYKEELEKKILADAKGGPIGARVAFPGLSLGSATQTSAGALDGSVAAGKDGEDEDFFDDWDKPAGATSTKAQTARAAPAISNNLAPPGIGKRLSPAPVSANSSGFNTPERSSTPTITSSKTLNASRNNSSTSVNRKGALGATKISTSSVGGSKKLGGVKKATGLVNFEEAERRAKEEEAKAKRMEEEALQEKESFEQAEAMAKAAIQAATASQAAHTAHNGRDTNGPKSPASPTRTRTSAETERLGMGFGRLNMGAARVAAKQERGKTSNGDAGSSLADEPNYARSKFAGQKSISSDQYFERGNYDANQSAEAKERLQGFTNQTSISSNQYFGREEEEEGAGGLPPSTSGDDWAGDFEQTAKEYYSRLMANPDVQQGIESFRAGAMKLSQYLEDMSRNGA